MPHFEGCCVRRLGGVPNSQRRARCGGTYHAIVSALRLGLIVGCVGARLRRETSHSLGLEVDNGFGVANSSLAECILPRNNFYKLT